MALKLDISLIERFRTLISSPPPAGRQKEQVVQDFLEEHTELIPTPNRLNHHLHFGVVASKFPLSTELITDYLYITKSSDTWRITLVELESPDKDIYTSGTKRTNTSAAFNAAMDQVRSWKLFMDDNKNEVIRKLEPLLRPISMRQNPIEFHYHLIIGRSQNKNLSDARKKYFRGLIQESGIDIFTYDQLIDWYNSDQRYIKNIIRLSGTQYAFKYIHTEPHNILAYIGPDCLEFSKSQMDHLISLGYEMEKWKKGDLLTYNQKIATSTWQSEHFSMCK